MSKAGSLPDIQNHGLRNHQMAVVPGKKEDQLAADIVVVGEEQLAEVAVGRKYDVRSLGEEHIVAAAAVVGELVVAVVEEGRIELGVGSFVVGRRWIDGSVSGW